MPMISVRLETPDDREAIRGVNKAAFDRPDEADLVDRLRDEVPACLSLVAMAHQRVVGHILFTPVAVQPDGAPPDEHSFEAFAIGPMAVLPSHQHQGVGRTLILSGLDACRRNGWSVIFVLGHPGYYPRFGFEPAKQYGFTTSFDVPDEAFMVRALTPDALDGRSGQVTYHPLFDSV